MRTVSRGLSGIILAWALLALAACGGGGSSSSGPTGATYTASSGVAQKGPLIQGSTVTAQELNASLSPTGKQYTYQITSNLGTFAPTSHFSSQYIGLNASGYYFDEVANAVSSGQITLNGYSDLTVDTTLNVNLLTTLAYQRIQTLVTQSSMSFTAARTQAETEVLQALNIPSGSYGSFDSLDLSGTTDGDHILAAVSSLFVYGNSASTLSSLVAAFQNDIGTHGVITNAQTKATLVAAAKGVNLASVAANLTQEYSSEGLTFSAQNLSDWIATSGDGVIGKFAFQVPDATPTTVFTFPAAVVTEFAGDSVTVTAGQLSVNGVQATGAVTIHQGDTVTLTPSAGPFPSGVFSSYLVSGSTNLVKVSFVSGLVSIAVTPSTPGVPVGLTQQFTATGTFSDTSTADVTSSVTWSSSVPAIATVNATSGLANAVAVGPTVITATSGSVSGNTTLNVTSAVVESIAITPNPAVVGIAAGTDLTTQLTATGTYSDGTTANVTTSAMWTSNATGTATVGPTTGVATAVATGTATITATIGSVTGTVQLSVVTNVWEPTGNMANIRSGHTATLLTNGKVLVAGGSTDTADTATAEIYDPATGTWTTTGSLNTARQSHTATLLADGTVLVVGGLASTSTTTVALASAEIYDPTLGTWTATGSLTTARFGHTATLLPDGTVLVVGGGNLSTTAANATAEIYNPTTRTWTVAAPPATARTSHTATLLPNGTVLVAGGENNNGGIASAEIYDPVAGTWTATGSLITGRCFHSATLLQNGTVLVVGGGGANGGGSNGLYPTPLTSAELFDPSTGTWTATAGSLSTPMVRQTATLRPDGTVLIAGGGYSWPDGFFVLADAYVYDPVAGTWSATQSLPAERIDHTATLLSNGSVLISGGTLVQIINGVQYSGATNTALVYY